MRDLAKYRLGRQLILPCSSLPILEDVDIVLEELDQSLFPGVPSSVKVHSGFKDAHAK